MEEILRTSSEWLSRLHPGTIILDPDGWDRSNYEYSFYKERITSKEFNERLIRSTIA